MKNIIIIILLTIMALNSFAQGCGLLSGRKDKKTGLETKGGVVNSKDFYSLLIQKRLDSNDSLNYDLFLNAASRIMLPDSLLNSKGSFELFLASGKKIAIENAECQNDPLGFGASIGFTAKTTEKIVVQLISDPIQGLRVFGIL